MSNVHPHNVRLEFAGQGTQLKKEKNPVPELEPL